MTYLLSLPSSAFTNYLNLRNIGKHYQRYHHSERKEMFRQNDPSAGRLFSFMEFSSVSIFNIRSLVTS